jgi:RNA polymerase sigma-70 factor, ECF subfamily
LKDRRGKTRAAVRTDAGRANEISDDGAERSLIEAAQRDPRRFAELYENNFERVYAFIARRVGDRDHAQDLTADVFHSALANLGRFEWCGVPFSAWLFRIAAAAITDRSKHAAPFQAFQLPEDPLEDSGEVAQPGLQEIERRVRLFKLVGRLPKDQRRVITMRFAHQKSIPEIATEIGRSEGAIKQLQFRGLQSLLTMAGDR